MKTKEQIIEWLKAQDWFKEFCANAGFLDEGELSNYVMRMNGCKEHLIEAAFVWPHAEYNFWQNAEYDYLTWLRSGETKPESVPDDSRFIFDRGSKEAPFYMVYAEGKSAPTYKHGSMEEATKEADRLAKLLNTNTYVLAAVMEIRPEIVTSAVGIDDMEHQVENPF